MGEIVVIARVEAKPGQEKELERVWTKAIVASRKEAGCVSYKLLRSTERPSLFVSVEKWASKESADAHMGTAHVQELLRLVPGLVASAPDIKPFEEIF